MYGPDAEPKNLVVNRSALVKAYDEAGNSIILNLDIDGGKEKANVLIQEVDHDPVTEFIRHVDFYKFKAGEKLSASIALKFINAPKTVKELGATLVTNIDEIDVRCLPEALVAHIDVDLSTIEKIDDTISVKDLKLPEGMELETDSDILIAVTNVEEVKDIPTGAPDEQLPEDQQASAEGADDKKDA